MRITANSIDPILKTILLLDNPINSKKEVVSYRLSNFR